MELCEIAIGESCNPWSCIGGSRVCTRFNLQHAGDMSAYWLVPRPAALKGFNKQCRDLGNPLDKYAGLEAAGTAPALELLLRLASSLQARCTAATARLLSLLCQPQGARNTLLFSSHYLGTMQPCG